MLVLRVGLSVCKYLENVRERENGRFSEQTSRETRLPLRKRARIAKLARKSLSNSAHIPKLHRFLVCELKIFFLECELRAEENAAFRVSCVSCFEFLRFDHGETKP